MNVKKIAREIHENAVKHGFWENDDLEQKFALIHDEWSEALEADRNGEPLAEIDEHGKPRGVLVELIDGVIRIIDLCEAVGSNIEEIKPMGITLGFYETVNDVHYHTAHLCGMLRLNKISPRFHERIEMCCGLIFQYIIEQGYDPMTILEWKHKYNLSRPYKHGKKY